MSTTKTYNRYSVCSVIYGQDTCCSQICLTSIKIQNKTKWLEMHISRREIGKREIRDREISRGKWGTEKNRKIGKKLPFFGAKLAQKTWNLNYKMLPNFAYGGVWNNHQTHLIEICISIWILINVWLDS